MTLPAVLSRAVSHRKNQSGHGGSKVRGHRRLAVVGVFQCVVQPGGTKQGFASYFVREETRLIERRIDHNDGTLTLFLSGRQDLTKLKVQETLLCADTQARYGLRRLLYHDPFD